MITEFTPLSKLLFPRKTQSFPKIFNYPVANQEKERTIAVKKAFKCVSEASTTTCSRDMKFSKGFPDCLSSLARENYYRALQLSKCNFNMRDS